ncbi:MAG: NBR1-Ig-like domain-containing protein [Chloroflexota bacterium]
MKRWMKALPILIAALLIAILAVVLNGCGGISIPALQPLAKATPTVSQLEVMAETPVITEPVIVTSLPPEEPTESSMREDTGESASGLLAKVDSIEIKVAGSLPVNLDVIARGSFPDKCTSIDKSTVNKEDSTFRALLTTKRTTEGECTEALTTFEEKIPLDVVNLSAGLYTVDVNGVIGTFEFAMDNKAPQEKSVQAQPQTSGARNVIAGIVWHDLCASITGSQDQAGCIKKDGRYIANGILEIGEPGIEGITVSLKEGDCGMSGARVSQVMTTDSQGKFTFSDVMAGDYCVSIDENAPGNKGRLLGGVWTYPPSQASVKVSMREGDNKSDINFGWDYQPELVTLTPTPQSGFQFTPAINLTPSGLPPSGGGVNATPFPSYVVTALPVQGIIQTPVNSGVYIPPALPSYNPPVNPLLPLPSSSGCTNRVALVSESTAPSGTTFQPGMSIVKTWRVRNNGTCTWQTGYNLVFVGGDSLNAASPTNLTGDVAPNATVDISIQLMAPVSAGTFTGNFMLRSLNGEVFGLGDVVNQPFTVQINVSGFGIYPTPEYKTGQAEELKHLGQPTWMDTFWNDVNWNLVDDENMYWKVRNGELYMTARKKTDIDHWAMSRQPVIQDFYLEMQASTGPLCGGFDSYGMIVRAIDDDSGYVFGITCNGTYRLYQWDHGYFKNIQPYTASQYINVGTYKKNRLGIMAVGQTLTLYINGYKVGEYANDWFARGQFGLMLGPNQTQNLTIMVSEMAYWQFR